MKIAYPEEVDRWGFADLEKQFSRKESEPKKEKAKEPKERGDKNPPEGKTERKERSSEKAKKKAKETKESEQPEQVCQECKKMGIEDKPATMKVRVGGRERWLCESCLQAAGYELGR